MSMRHWRATGRNAVGILNRLLGVYLKPRCYWNNRSRSYNREYCHPCFWVKESGNTKEALNEYRNILKNAVKDDFTPNDFLFPGKQHKNVGPSMDGQHKAGKGSSTHKTPAKKKSKKVMRCSTRFSVRL